MTSRSTELEEHLDALTKPQRSAVDWNRGPLLVLAGPGSGKTRVLTLRIARLLSESADETFRILALTFTNRAADEMRTRVERLAPNMENRLFIGTFHAFCTEVLRQNGVELGLRSDFKIYSAPEDRAEILQDVLASPVGKRNFETVKNLKLQPLFDRLRSSLVSADKVVDVFRDKVLGQAVGEVYAAHEEFLISNNAQDFCSLIFNAHQLFQRFPVIAKRYRRTYKYWNIDEFQDSNNSQFQLLMSMAGEEFLDVFVVADDDQIIYQWNGASYKRLDEFSDAFSPEVIQLPTNFRCPPEVVELANNLVLHNSLRRSDKRPILAIDPEGATPAPPVRLLKFATAKEEAIGVASAIAKRIADGEREIAVLARTRQLLEQSKEQLDHVGVSCRVVQRKDEFQSTPFAWLHSCLKQANSRADSRNIRVVVESFNQLTGTDIDAGGVIAESNATSGDHLRTWAITVLESSSISVAQVAVAEVRSRLVDSVDYLGFVSFALQWFTELTSEEKPEEEFSGFDEDLRAWAALWREIRASIGADANLETFLQELELRSKEPPARADEVVLMTIHGAKGNEFDSVYVIGMAEDVLPSFQSKKKGADSAELEEERRNCFVAITRTKRTLTLSYAGEYRGWRKDPSRFLGEMGLAI